MAIEFKRPWLGIAIPIFLIAFIGYGAHYFILANYMHFNSQVWFECSLSMIWLSYFLAIKTEPGEPPRNFRPQKSQWKQFCNKCNNFKPERTHHCKKCQKCVLVMDHHCPWTMNCVGYRNYPHFLRFLFWIIATTAFLGFQLAKRIGYLWRNRNDRLFIEKTEIASLVVLTPLNGFVLLTICILFLRCVKNQIFKGMTQIESWEMDRIENLFENRRLIPQLVENLKELHPDAHLNDTDCRRLLSSKRISFDDIVNFPYDINPWINAKIYLSSVNYWLLPWGCPGGDGTFFQKNDIALYEPDAPLVDKLLSLPWPPDGGRQKSEIIENSLNDIEISTQGGEHVIRKRWIDPRVTMPRSKWYNDWGENLSDFGVDIDAETDKT